MNRIDVSLLMKEEGYGQALMRGLAEAESGFFLRLVDRDTMQAEKEPVGVLITDDPVFADDEAGRVLCIDRPVSVSWLCGEIRERACRLGDGRQWSCAEDRLVSCAQKGPIICGFFSRLGGSGVTTVAIMTARLLAERAAARGEKQRILYVDLTEHDDTALYVAGAFRDVRTKQELLFRLERNLPVHLPAYCHFDCHGVAYLRPEAGRNSLPEENLRRIAQEIGMDVVIADMGRLPAGKPAAKGMCDDGEQPWNLLFQVERQSDLRQAVVLQHDAVFVMNRYRAQEAQGVCDEGRSAMSGITNADFVIHEDRESFSLSESGQIAMEMTKTFGQDVGRIAAQIEKR